jgi:hypothetical protein
MRLSSIHPTAFAAALLACLGAGAAAAADNIVPIEVRQLHDGMFNLAYVDVTVCNAVPQCRTVPNVVVDTGSSGLRLHREALDGLQLEPVRDGIGRRLGNAAHFASGGLWGTLHAAQLRIGQVETTRAIPIQLFDAPSPLERLPASYDDDARARFIRMGNGVLGMSPRRHDPQRYFALSRWGPKALLPAWTQVYVDASRQVVNPIIHFPEPYHNGSVISLPEVDRGAGQKTAQGWLGFGVGQPTESLFPAAARVMAHELDEQGKFAAMLGGRRVDLVVDSGSNVLMLDLEPLGLPRHERFKRFYDTAPLTPLPLAFGANEIELARPLCIGPAANMNKALEDGYAVLPMLAIAPIAADAPNVLGLPFFFGRTVATGLQGAGNPFPPEPPYVGPTLNFDGAETVSLEDDSDAEPVAQDAGAKTADAAFVPAPSPNGFIAFSD